MSLTVREAIEQLQRFDLDAPVRAAIDGDASVEVRDVGRYERHGVVGPAFYARSLRLPVGRRVTRTGRHSMRGEVIGYDADLCLPLIEWDDGSGPEACEFNEFKETM